jgi:hypothetical protein
MRAARIGPLLLGLGLVVGAAAGVGLLVGFEPAQLPRALLNIAAYKLTFLAAAGLIVAGALVLRYGRREPAGRTAVPNTEQGTRALAERLAADAVPTGTRRPEAVQSRKNRADH